MTLNELKNRTGGLSAPSKMPGFSYNLPATECKTGSKLRKVQGSTCAKCYAMKGRYRFANVSNAMHRRLDAITRPDWVDSMVEEIEKREKNGFFRWHDSGDIQSLDHLRKIAEVARRLPHIQFWLPTREYSIYSEFLRTEVEPPNLCVRVSALKVDFPAPRTLGGNPVLSSTVHKDSTPQGHKCPAPTQGNQCGDCRACWDRSIENVSYHIH